MFLRCSSCLVALACLLQLTASAQKAAEKVEPAITFHFSDITSSSGIHFQHAISPEKKYIMEAMSGGVLLLDYDQDGWLDIYFTNAPSVAMALHGEKAKSALYRNNHRSEEHTSELQSQSNLVCRLLLEKKKLNCNIV